MKVNLIWDEKPEKPWQYCLVPLFLSLATIMYFLVALPWVMVMDGVAKLVMALDKWGDRALARGNIQTAWAFTALNVLPYNFYCFMAPCYRAVGRLYMVLVKWRPVELNIDTSAKSKR